MFPIAELADLITFNPWSVSLDTELAALEPLLEETWLKHWPVIDAEHRVVGVVTDEDVMRVAMERELACEAVAAGVRGPALLPSLPVESFMVRRFVIVDREESPRRALKLLLTHDLPCLPVVDQGRLIGVIGRSDFLRELSYSASPLAGEPVTRFVTPDQESVEIDAPLEEAKLMMEAAGKYYVAVERGGVPLGVVSRRELRHAHLRQRWRGSIEAESVSLGPLRLAELVAEAPALRPGQPVREAAGLMAERSLQAVVVVNQAHRLVGVLSEDELLHAMLNA